MDRNRKACESFYHKIHVYFNSQESRYIKFPLRDENDTEELKKKKPLKEAVLINFKMISATRDDVR